jgi:hypothetical protein
VCTAHVSAIAEIASTRITPAFEAARMTAQCIRRPGNGKVRGRVGDASSTDPRTGSERPVAQ